MYDIPFEILTIVFSHLSKTDASQGVLVCKKWHEAGTPFLHKDLSWTSYHVTRLKKRMKLRPVTRDRYFKQGIWTKTLEIHQDHSDYLSYDTELDTYEKPDLTYAFDKRDWLLLLEYFPNLEILDFTGSGNGNRYLRYIKEAGPSNILPKIQDFAADVMEPCVFANWNTIYFGACYKHRASITSLYVIYKDLYVDLGFVSGEMLTLLGNFNHLTDLTLENKYDNQLTTFDIQDACPHLISLKYKSAFGIPDLKVKTIIDEADPRKLDFKMKKLEITVPSITKNYANYITNYVSPYVDNLNLSMNKVDLYDWIDEIGYDTALGLFRSFSTLEYISINWIPRKTYQRQSVHDNSDATIFFSLLHVLQGDKKMYCSSTYDILNPYRKTIKRTPNMGLNVTYGLNYYDYYFQNVQNSAEDINSNPLNRSILIALPNTLISTIGPEIVHNMSVEMLDTNPDLLINFLRFALSNCPNLQHFYFCSSNSVGQICLGTNMIISRYGTKQRKELTSTLKENIKVVKLRNTLPSEEMTDLIRTYIPDIETFACGSSSRLNQPNTITIDLTELGHLKEIYLEVSCLGVNNNVETAYMGIQCREGVHSYYRMGLKKHRCTIHTTSLDYMENQTRDDVNSRSTIFKCDRYGIKFVFYLGSYKIAEIVNGRLIQIPIKDQRADYGVFL